MRVPDRLSLYWLSLIVLALGLASCGRVNPGEDANILAEIAPAEATTTPSPTTEISATPTLTATLEPSPTPTITPTPTLTPHPMSIPALRQMGFPGSEIVIEEQLTNGPNYFRYYAYYLSEGLKIYALLTVPYSDPPEGGYPAIVFNHGYIPPEIYRTTERYIAYVDSLASSGYVVFRIDYRGNDRSEGTPSGAYGDPGYTIDVMNAVTSLQNYPEVNPEKIGMWGHSMGGFLTLRAMVISNQVKAGVIWAGVVGSYSDLFCCWRRGDRPTSTPDPDPSSSRRWRSSWVSQFGSPEDNPEFWDSLSANTYLDDISGPVQLHHGTADESVPLEFSETLYQQLQDLGKPVELYTYEGDNHNISNLFSLAMTRTIEFYDRYLK